MAGMINLQGVPFNKTPPSEMSHPILLKVICDRIWNRGKYFKIATFLIFEQGTVRAGNLSANKKQNHLSWQTLHCFEFFHSG